jgi:hypothetical protein
MIHFLFSRGHDFELKDAKKTPHARAIRMMDYDALFKKSRLPFSTYVFTDMERLGYWDLELAGQLCVQLKNAGLKVLNDPARVKNRYALLKALHAAGLNDFDAYRAEEIPTSVRFPVFLRKLQGHSLPLSELLPAREDLDKAVEATIARGIPVENQIVVEFAGEPVAGGLYRKLAAFRIGEKIVPAICVHDTGWHVKTGKKGIAGEKLYREELEIIQTNPYAGHMRKVFDIAQIQFGRADFGFYRGRIQIFEINTNPHLKAFAPHPSPFREQSMRIAWEKFADALQQINSGGGPSLKLKKDKLSRYRKWSLDNLLTRSRKTG